MLLTHQVKSKVEEMEHFDPLGEKVPAPFKDTQHTLVPRPTEAGENSYPLTTENTPSKKVGQKE